MLCQKDFLKRVLMLKGKLDNKLTLKLINTKAATRGVHIGCSVKKLFQQILKNQQENTCVRVSFLIKLQASGLQIY